MAKSEKRDELRGLAVIGLAGRFPGARDVAEFWQNLRNGVESVRFFSDEELLATGIDPAVLRHPQYVKASGALDGADLFDAAFFGYSPAEAELMDPQHRVFLECAYEALEAAGYGARPADLSVGVYAGAGMNSYLLHNFGGMQTLVRSSSGLEMLIGADKDFLPTRISYKLNLRGPSIAIQTACSTSLVAVCQACQALLNYQCDLALAGGVSIGVPLKAGCFYQEGGITSPDGHCRAFDAQAQGMVSGHGSAVVVLKRLADAVADGDTIWGVIKGFAVNNDGNDKIGYTAPSITGQAEVIAMAQALAQIDPDTISYVEAHGTGTVLGDPIEIAALTQAFRARTQRKAYCAIGSVKTNFGHLNAAAGAAGLIKSLLALHHAELPPSLNYATPNPKIDFANSPFFVNTQLQAWPRSQAPRRAGVSSFGMGGTNAHVVLEEAPAVAADTPRRPWQLLVLSARTEQALEQATRNLATHFECAPETPVAEVAYTLQVGRESFAHRRAFVCRDGATALAALRGTDAFRVISGRSDGAEREVVFMFPGQGSQYPGMLRELYETEPVFRTEVDACAVLLKRELDLDLLALLYPAADDAEAAKRLAQTAVAQPALFAVEYALARLWISWGIKPAAMIGHSSGEFVAACLAGVFTRDDALRLVAERGRLMQSAPPGAMLAVPMSAGEVGGLLNGELAVATINEATQCVVAGPAAAIDAFEAQLKERSIPARRLHTSHAFHSPMMGEVVAPFAARVAKVTRSAPQIRYLSNVTGTWVTAAEATSPEYWGRHLREPVQFAAGLTELLQQPGRVLLEVGPGNTLTSFAVRHPGRQASHAVTASGRHPQEQRSDTDVLLTALGRLWTVGVRPDWAALWKGERRRRVPLPTYPFERQRYWLERDKGASATTAADPDARLDMDAWFSAPTWQRSDLPAVVEAQVAGGERWLVFADDTGLSAALQARLERGGQRVVRVTAGSAYAARAADEYVIRPDAGEDYAALLEALGGSPERIVHAWSVARTAREHQLADVQATLQRGFYSLLHLAQALARQPHVRPVQIAMLTSGAFDVVGGDAVSPAQATAWGPCRTLTQELPHLACRLIDVLAPADGAAAGRVAEQLWRELTSGCTEPLLALRGLHRWTRAAQLVRLADPGPQTPLLRPRGVYLITGGLGGIGLVLGRYLARQFRARLILTTRTALPAPTEYDQWLRVHPPTDATSTRIRALRELQTAGAEVQVVQADVADYNQMKAVCELGAARFGAVRGVIHCAGVPGGGLVQLKTPAAAAAVLAPKVQGTLVLAELLRNQPLDFLMVCSSLTALFGGVGQVDYAAANAFLDAFAQAERGRGGLPAIAVNWDGWRESGMAVTTAVPAELQAARRQDLSLGLSDDEGVEVFRRTLAAGLPQVAVSTRDLGARLRRAERSTAPVAQAAAATPVVASTKAAHARPALSTAYVAPRDELEQTIATVCQELLGVTPLGIHDNFFELGAHSLLALRLIARLNETLQVELPPNRFFEAPTVAQLAEKVAALRLARAAADAQLAELVQMVENMSEEEVRALLAQEG